MNKKDKLPFSQSMAVKKIYLLLKKLLLIFFEFSDHVFGKYYFKVRMNKQIKTVRHSFLLFLLVFNANFCQVIVDQSSLEQNKHTSSNEHMSNS